MLDCSKGHEDGGEMKLECSSGWPWCIIHGWVEDFEAHVDVSPLDALKLVVSSLTTAKELEAKANFAPSSYKEPGQDLDFKEK